MTENFNSLKKLIKKKMLYTPSIEQMDKGDEILTLLHSEKSGSAFMITGIVSKNRIDVCIMIQLSKKSPHLANEDALLSYFKAKLEREIFIGKLVPQKVVDLIIMIDVAEFSNSQNDISVFVQGCLDLDL